jgi:hypothetical protein
MSELRYPEWQIPYEESFMELGPRQLLEWINAAEATIFVRLQEMRIGLDDLLQGQAIQDALDALLRLKNETLKFTDSFNEMCRITEKAGNTA